MQVNQGENSPDRGLRRPNLGYLDHED